ncbi:alpha-galactosidase [Cryptomeria japonica]|uniref:alpha-galactosidase n=1 Tax=Cryptomeria japonica TaxID=3369 RepID=UPI0025AB6F8B|nr:alpha-galactosidase [Cryptomeria japonica]
MKMVSVLFVTLLGICLCFQANATYNGLGQKPPMGWNGREYFFCSGINENAIRGAADALISTGLSKLGYEYVNIDDCWGEKHRDAQGNLIAKATTFPSGIKVLADYVHSKGLKLGIYADAGSKTCSGRMTGSIKHEQHDANTFASWGVDYLTYMSCYIPEFNPLARYQKMSKALLKTGRPIFFATGNWYNLTDYIEEGPKVANSWLSAEIGVRYVDMLDVADQNNELAAYAGPKRGWNDVDVLQIGKMGPSWTIEEYRSQFSIWALMKAPLIITTDLRNASQETLEILGNKEVIDVNQDSLGVQGKKVSKQGDLEVWAGPLSNKRVTVALWNRGNSTASITAKWKDIGLSSKTVVQARDLWAHSYLPTSLKGSLTSSVDSHVVKMYILTPIYA